jgi:hypothetical protein
MHPTAKKATTTTPPNIPLNLPPDEFSFSPGFTPCPTPCPITCPTPCSTPCSTTIPSGPVVSSASKQVPLKIPFHTVQAATQLPKEPAAAMIKALTPKVFRLFTTRSFAPTCNPKKKSRSQMVYVILFERYFSQAALRIRKPYPTPKKVMNRTLNVKPLLIAQK